MTALEIIFKEYELLLEYQKQVDLSGSKGASTSYEVKLQQRLETLRSMIDTTIARLSEREGSI